MKWKPEFSKVVKWEDLKNKHIEFVKRWRGVIEPRHYMGKVMRVYGKRFLIAVTVAEADGMKRRVRPEDIRWVRTPKQYHKIDMGKTEMKNERPRKIHRGW